jgi:hypothetical protein
MSAIGRSGKWRPQTNRQKCLVVLTVTLVACAAAIVIPSMRAGLLSVAGYSIVNGWLATESRRSRSEPEALAARLAALPPGDVPADVVTLVASGKKIQAIKRYRQLTGTSLSEAKAYIDGLSRPTPAEPGPAATRGRRNALPGTSLSLIARSDPM